MSDISINLIKKRIESSGNITPKVAKIFAENIGTLLKEYKSEVNMDQLIREALKKENHPKPSELLSRYRVYPDKVYNEKTFERLAKDPKKYLSIVICLAELLSLNEDYFIRTLVSKTRFSKEDLSEEDENYDFGPINRINDIIRTYSLSIIDRYNLKEFHQSNLAKEISLKWDEELRKDKNDINENLYEVCDLRNSDEFFRDFISKIPLIERMHKMSPCKFSNSHHSNIYSRFLIEGDRISLGLFYDNDQKRILPKIIIEPFLYLPGVSLEKEFLQPIYVFKSESLNERFLSHSELTFNHDFIENVDKNLYPFSINLNEINSYNSYGKSQERVNYTIQYSSYTLDSHYLDSIVDEKDWVKSFLSSDKRNDLINIIDLDNQLWTRILKNSIDDQIGRPGLAFCYNFPMNIETKLVSSDKLDKNRHGFYTEVLSNILNESIGIKTRDTNNIRSYFIDYYFKFLDFEDIEMMSSPDYDDMFDEDRHSTFMKEFNIDNICFSQNYLEIYIKQFPLLPQNKFPAYFKEFDTGLFDFMEVLEKDIKKRVEATNKIKKNERDYIEKKYEKKIAKIKSLGKN